MEGSTVTEQHICGVMFTMTTYGTWLRGDMRGWCEDGRVFPSSPPLEAHDRELMNHPPFLFEKDQLYGIGENIGRELMKRLQQRSLALTGQTWHVHLVVADSQHRVPVIAKCAKESVRYALRAGQRIWTEEYDKRYCFNHQSLRTRIEYVERHNTAMGWPPRPWKFILAWDEY